jgi:DNA-directed RNA polymerase delta subunit
MVMSFEDIEEARIKRVAEDATKNKGKRGRKGKSAALEADEADVEAEAEAEEELEVAHFAKGAVQETDEPNLEPEVARMLKAPRRAPVARMY